jgi:zinc D-Ala-D-Ala dipeptidase
MACAAAPLTVSDFVIHAHFYPVLGSITTARNQMSYNFALKCSGRSLVGILAAAAIIALNFALPAIALEMKPVPGPVTTEKELIGISPLELRLMQNGLLNVGTLDDSLIIDLKYARADNFMGANVYGDFTQAYLRAEAALKLVKANKILRERHPNLRILVADAFRPRSIQHQMWKHVVDTPMQPYVANPHSGSMHNYGGAVDVSLYDLERGEQLDMGTPLDFFGPLAQPRLEAKFLREGQLSEEQIKNRLILRNAMVDAGWHMLQIEWWHFEAFPRSHIRRHYSIIE